VNGRVGIAHLCHLRLCQLAFRKELSEVLGPLGLETVGTSEGAIATNDDKTVHTELCKVKCCLLAALPLLELFASACRAFVLCLCVEIVVVVVVVGGT
jgi:hypothetical protein